MVDYRKLVRENIYFQTEQGSLSPQDLWKLNVSKLRNIGRNLYAEIKDYQDEDRLFFDLELEDKQLIQKKTKEQALLTLKFEVVKDIIQTKIEEQQARLNKAQKEEEIERLTALLHEKQNEELAAKPASELRDMIAALQKET